MSGQSYDELMAKIADLQKQAEEVRRAELDAVIADVRAKIKKYNLSASDIGLSGGTRKAGRPATAKVKIAPGNTGIRPRAKSRKSVQPVASRAGWFR